MIIKIKAFIFLMGEPYTLDERAGKELEAELGASAFTSPFDQAIRIDGGLGIEIAGSKRER